MQSKEVLSFINCNGFTLECEVQAHICGLMKLLHGVDYEE